MLEIHTQLHIAVCDDDVQDLAVMVQTVQRVMEKLKIKFSLTTFASSSALEEYLQEQDSSFDLFILDILMEGKNGMVLANQLRESGTRAALIFETNTPDYALDGYKVDADDYLLKPVTEEMLCTVLKRIFIRHSTILIDFDGVSRPLRLSEILFAESVGHYAMIHMEKHSEQIRIRASLPMFLQQLGEQHFARCHKGYIVGLGQIAQVNPTTVLLRDGTSVPLGRKYRKALLETLVQYVEQCLPTL